MTYRMKRISFTTDISGHAFHEINNNTSKPHLDQGNVAIDEPHLSAENKKV